MGERYKSKLIVDLLLYREKENGKKEVLLCLRQNTGHHDGEYDLPGGHVEAYEDIFEAMIREAKEEIGIDIQREDLSIIHIYHNFQKNALKFVFKVSRYKNEVKNCEENVCKELRWFDINNLPNNIIPGIRIEIENIKNNILFNSDSIIIGCDKK